MDVQEKIRESCLSAKRTAILAHEGEDFAGRGGKLLEGVVDGSDQAVESREVLQMSGLLFDLFPQELDGIEVRRVGRKLELGQAVDMRSKEGIHGLAGMVSGAILDEDDMLMSLGQDSHQKSLIALLVEATIVSFPE